MAFKALTRTEMSDGYREPHHRPEPTTTYQVESLLTGDQRRVHLPRWHPDRGDIGTDGSRKTTLADGTDHLLEGPDPRFSMQAPLPKSLTTTTGGLTSTLTTQRSVNLANPTDPLSLTSQSDTVQLNGRTFTSVYNAATKTTTNTSASGRKALRPSTPRGG